PGVTNIIRGNDPAGWQAGLRTYSRVVYPDLWDGIDLVYRSEGGQLKYDLVLRPGSDPVDVLFDLSGHEDIMVDARGDLVVTTVAGVIRDTGLVAFYANEPTATIDCAFILAGDDTYGFRLGEYDPSRTVVIDPLVYSTYVGGGNGELEEPTAGVVVDGSGRALVAGQTNTTDFPVTVGAFQASNAGGETDLFVLRMAADGSDVEWSTYLGGTGADYPYDIAVDGNGLPVVVGRTNSTDFPTTFGAYDTTHTGSDHEGFIFKLNGGGTALDFSTYLGGNNTDELAAVVLDDTDNVYVAGNTLSSDLPTSVGAAFPNQTGTSFDAFIAKVHRSGSSLEGLTYLGGAKWDVAVAIDVDDQGWVYVGGETISTDFPATNGSFQDFLMNNLSRDAFIAKVGPDLDSLGWATYIGGLSNDYVEFLHVDGNGSVYAAGDTESGMFPVTNNSFQMIHEGASDTFILQMAANGSQLEYSTFLGGSNDDYCEGFAVDDAGRACVVGSTLSADFPTMTGVQQEVRAGKFDTFLFRLDVDWTTPLYSTYLGGTEWDLANGLYQDTDGDAYIVGATDSTNFPTTAGAYQEDHGGRVDVFITKLDLFLDTEPPTAIPGTDMIVEQHDTVDFD
ncbi:MAG: SBBP repeat-containing protein, partial [Thermoplasmata archaeon]|nr:SBBP repeat-containing protein [Thermoplasmata archaeon]